MYRLPNMLVLLGCAVMAFVLLPMGESSAQSNSRQCKNLNAQLASLNRGGGNSKKYRQYSNAVRSQENQLSKAQKAQRRGGCRLLRKNTKSCRNINDTIAKMRRNLASLKSKRDRFAPRGAGNSQKKRQLQRQIARACAPKAKTRTASAQTTRKERRRSILEKVFGKRTYENEGRERQQPQNAPPIKQPTVSPVGGVNRTLCVRKQDGYYFPISFSANRSEFDLHEELCQRMCPGLDVGLYIHHKLQEDSEDMVSYRGERPYRDEPFAFAYRKVHNPDLQCRYAVAGLSEHIGTTVTDDSGLSREDIRKSRIGIPVFRVDQTNDPAAYDDAMANLDYGKVLAAIDRANAPEQKIADREFDPERRIRIVGPAFFPVQ